MKTAVHPRSYLFVPGHKPALMTKALRCGADAVIIDMEDAVPAGLKAEARQQVADVLTKHDGDGTGPEIWLRINETGSPDAASDLAAFAGLVFGFRVPKADRPADVEWQPPGPTGRRSSSQSRPPGVWQLPVISPRWPPSLGSGWVVWT